ncbi:MAG TPA: hypothetical protein DCX25_01790 [Candidatus Pacebacteria bacterium]|nr:MAG: hypothetical protein UX00_C0002G0024 [Microgenomates group bacterium GW2011_GWB1_45_17]KKU23100.1 MAG: hypothetical protein UX35_C0010G0018 [Microgenomates group bacterium GW2011_GWA1_46_15]KKU23763.1 MAG: hypothetical protein UX36_C0003G0063 [Microgenomates group bacterium GW2011_GWC1_46_15]HAV15037.1 hypothetical protein [Candidatus Paceibacterota bacterium]HCR11706.1 hypothetical protein [Candidatus Paceibacterota bacterium]
MKRGKGLASVKEDARPKRGGGMQSISSVLQNFALDDKGGRISREFQDFGYRLSRELNDEAHTSLYIKMAKTVDRSILEQARSFVLDANARSKGKLFMWKVAEIRRARQGGKTMLGSKETP